MKLLVIASRCAAAGLLAAFAVASHAAPRVFPLQPPAGAHPPDARKIADYPEAVAAIVWVVVNRFDLPTPRGTVEVHPTREGFEQALIRHLKIAPDLARSTAQFAKSAVGSRTILVNQPAVASDRWPQRVELLAHEVAHVVQLTLANRPGIPHPQWLIEGLAEWMAIHVTDALGLEDLDAARSRMAVKLRDPSRKGVRPPILQVVTFADWVEARKRYGYDGTYTLSFFVADFLIERHSLAAVADFFRRFENSDDYAAHFRAAFGEDIGTFEHALDTHLDRMLR